MNVKHLVIPLAFLGILILYFIACFSQPPYIDIQDIANYEDKQVMITGTVVNHHITSYGSQLIEIHDINTTNNNATVTLFVEKATPVEFGDSIQATGTVQKYRDEWEIIVDNERHVKILQKWHNISTPLWQLAKNPAQYAGMNVNITGVIEHIHDDYFSLADAEGPYSIIVQYDQSFEDHFYYGNQVTVAGQFVYDDEQFRYILQVNPPDHHILISTEE